MCMRRYQVGFKGTHVKAPWSKEEDEKLVELVNQYGPKKWTFIALNLPGRRRRAKQVRERWVNHLDPNVNKKDPWTEEEDRLILETYQSKGTKWSDMAKQLPGR